MSIMGLLESEAFFTLILAAFGIGVLFFVIMMAILHSRLKATNDASPLTTSVAKIVSKESIKFAKGLFFTFIFELESGERKSMEVQAAVANLMLEQDVGNLSYQGNRFISFERKIEK